MRIGIDLGGMSVKAGLVDNEYNIVKRDSIVTDLTSGEQIIKDIVTLCKRMADSQSDKIESIGIGVPGHVDSKTRRVVHCNNIPVANVDLRAQVEKECGIKTYIDNDANVAALGEVIAGAAKGYDSAVMITLGTGVGSGIVINKKIFVGCNGAAGELGHMVIKEDGLQCNCGRRGCYELYASATALIRQTREAMVNDPESIMWKYCDGDIFKVNGKTAFDALRAGDKTGAKVIDQFIKYLAVGVVDMIDILQPDAIIIGGGISKEGDYLVKPLQKIVEDERYSKGEVQTQIIIAERGNDAGIIGAAFLD